MLVINREKCPKEKNVTTTKLHWCGLHDLLKKKKINWIDCSSALLYAKLKIRSLFPSLHQTNKPNFTREIQEMWSDYNRFGNGDFWSEKKTKTKVLYDNQFGSPNDFHDFKEFPKQFRLFNFESFSFNVSETEAPVLLKISV